MRLTSNIRKESYIEGDVTSKMFKNCIILLKTKIARIKIAINFKYILAVFLPLVKLFLSDAEEAVLSILLITILIQFPNQSLTFSSFLP